MDSRISTIWVFFIISVLSSSISFSMNQIKVVDAHDVYFSIFAFVGNIFFLIFLERMGIPITERFADWVSLIRPNMRSTMNEAKR